MYASETSRSEQEMLKVKIGKIIGLSFTAMFFLGIFAEFIVRTQMIKWENPVLTFTYIQHSLELFDAGIFSFVLIIVLDVLLSISFFILFKSLNAYFALLMASLRLIYVAVKAFAIVGLMLARDIYSSSYESNEQLELYATQAMQYLKMHHYGFGVGLFFFGLHLMFLGILVSKTKGIPKLFVWMLLIGGLGYSINSIISLFANYFDILETVALVTFIIPMTFSELAFGIWLWVSRKKIIPLLKT